MAGRDSSTTEFCVFGKVNSTACCVASSKSVTTV